MRSSAKSALELLWLAIASFSYVFLDQRGLTSPLFSDFDGSWSVRRVEYFEDVYQIDYSGSGYGMGGGKGGGNFEPISLQLEADL